jgi:hypothetical protein
MPKRLKTMPNELDEQDLQQRIQSAEPNYVSQLSDADIIDRLSRDSRVVPPIAPQLAKRYLPARSWVGTTVLAASVMLVLIGWQSFSHWYVVPQSNLWTQADRGPLSRESVTDSKTAIASDDSDSLEQEIRDELEFLRKRSRLEFLSFDLNESERSNIYANASLEYLASQETIPGSVFD